MSVRALPTLFAAALALAGCGLKGPLYLPEKPGEVTIRPGPTGSAPAGGTAGAPPGTSQPAEASEPDGTSRPADSTAAPAEGARPGEIPAAPAEDAPPELPPSEGDTTGG